MNLITPKARAKYEDFSILLVLWVNSTISHGMKLWFHHSSYGWDAPIPYDTLVHVCLWNDGS